MGESSPHHGLMAAEVDACPLITIWQQHDQKLTELQYMMVLYVGKRGAARQNRALKPNEGKTCILDFKNIQLTLQSQNQKKKNFLLSHMQGKHCNMWGKNSFNASAW